MPPVMPGKNIKQCNTTGPTHQAAILLQLRILRRVLGILEPRLQLLPFACQLARCLVAAVPGLQLWGSAVQPEAVRIVQHRLPIIRHLLALAAEQHQGRDAEAWRAHMVDIAQIYNFIGQASTDRGWTCAGISSDQRSPAPSEGHETRHSARIFARMQATSRAHATTTAWARSLEGLKCSNLPCRSGVTCKLLRCD